QQRLPPGAPLGPQGPLDEDARTARADQTPADRQPHARAARPAHDRADRGLADGAAQGATRTRRPPGAPRGGVKATAVSRACRGHTQAVQLDETFSSSVACRSWAG